MIAQLTPQVIVVLGLAFLSTVASQVVSFTSNSNAQFACLNEPITYSCSVNGTGILVRASPFINNGFDNTNGVPSVHLSSNGNFVLTLIGMTPLWTVQLNVIQAADTNVTCSDLSGTSSEMLPLMLSSAPARASNVRLTGLTGNTRDRSVLVTWDLPTNPQFDVAHFRVEVLVDDKVCGTGNSTSNTMELEVPFNIQGTIQARVSTVSRCGVEANSTMSMNSISATYSDFYAAFLVPLLFIVILIGVVIGISIRFFYYYKQQKNNKPASVEHNNSEMK